MNEEQKPAEEIGEPPVGTGKEPQEEKPKEILVSLERYEALVLLVEALFNTINDRSPLGVVGNEFLTKLETIKKEINEAKN